MKNNVKTRGRKTLSCSAGIVCLLWSTVVYGDRCKDALVYPECVSYRIPAEFTDNPIQTQSISDWLDRYFDAVSVNSYTPRRSELPPDGRTRLIMINSIAPFSEKLYFGFRSHY